MIETLGPLALTGFGSCAAGYIAGLLHKGYWKRQAEHGFRQLREQRAEFNQIEQRMRGERAEEVGQLQELLKGRDEEITKLINRVAKFEEQEARRLEQLRSIARKGAEASHAARKKNRAAAVAKTMAAVPAVAKMPSRKKVVAPVKAARARRRNKSGAGAAA